MNSIATYTGRTFSLSEPDFSFIDIGHALSNLCRFNGHSSRFYSVAQHCMLVQDIMFIYMRQQYDPIEGFLHDAHEAYISDVPKPFKDQLPGWSEFEDRLEALFWNWVPEDRRPKEIYSIGCKTADVLALLVEASIFVNPGLTHPSYAHWIEAGAKTMERYNQALDNPLYALEWRPVVDDVLEDICRYRHFDYMNTVDHNVIQQLWFDRLEQNGFDKNYKNDSLRTPTSNGGQGSVLVRST